MEPVEAEDKMERIGLLGDMRVEQEQVELLNSALKGVSSPIGKDQVCLSVDALHACYSGLVANARACKKKQSMPHACKCICICGTVFEFFIITLSLVDLHLK